MKWPLTCRQQIKETRQKNEKKQTSSQDKKKEIVP